METKINKEYQNLIDKLDKIITVCEESNFKTESLILKEVQHGLKMLGTTIVLPNNVKEFLTITQNMAKLYTRKNHDYGNSFEQSLDKFGILASIVRMGDKMNRIESLINKEAEVKDESIKDTLLDLATYGIMTVMWLNKNNKSEVLAN